MNYITFKSQNFSKKTRKSKDIKLIVIHYTGMQSKIASIKRLTNPKHKVSCHYLIDRQGNILKLVDDSRVAWHAGKSRWKNFINLNYNSIGIELINKGHSYGYEKFPSLQINKLIKVCLYLKKKYKIKDSNIVGHSDISPLRKQDPGEKFPWQKLYKYKIGIWYKESKLKFKKNKKTNLNNLFFKNLHKIGYRYFKKDFRSKNDVVITKAFQRRFLPKKVDGIIDLKSVKISHFLAENIKK